MTVLAAAAEASAALAVAEWLARDNHSSLLDLIVSYGENEVLLKRPMINPKL